jgi:hypothetical protein
LASIAEAMVRRVTPLPLVLTGTLPLWTLAFWVPAVPVPLVVPLPEVVPVEVPPEPRPAPPVPPPGEAQPVAGRTSAPQMRAHRA